MSTEASLPAGTIVSKVGFTFRVSASDGVGGTATGDVPITVRNVPPTVTITGPASGAIYPIGTAITFTGTFNDPGTADTHTALWTFDTTTQAGTVNETAKTVTASKTFATPGVYLVQLRVTDDDGGSGIATEVGGLTAIAVIYDPNTGFVTGGGWIDSPLGAYAGSRPGPLYEWLPPMKRTPCVTTTTGEGTAPDAW